MNKKITKNKTFTQKDVLFFRKRFIDNILNEFLLKTPILSEDNTNYAFEWIDSMGRTIVVNWKIIAGGIQQVNTMFFLKGTNILVAEFLVKEIIIEYHIKNELNEVTIKKEKRKNVLCCIVGNKIIWPLDALVTYKYNDLWNWTFDVIYINLKMQAKRAILNAKGEELEDKDIKIEEVKIKYWINLDF